VGETVRDNFRQEEILSHCASVIAREGYEKASIRKIAAEMGMSISALYYYFPGKEDLLFSIQYTSFDNVVRKLEEKLKGKANPTHKLYILIENHLEHFLSRLNELVICSHEINTLTGDAYEKVRVIRQRYYRIALGIVKDIKKKHRECVLEAPLAALNLFGMLNWIYMWYDPDKNKSYRTLAKEIYNLFLNGIKSRSRSSPM